MSPQPHDGPAEEGLASLTLSPVENSDCVGNLREMLSSFNHRCRNSLNGIKMSLYLFKRELAGPMPGSLGELERSYHQLEMFFDWLQMVYRPLSLTLVRSPLGRFFDERLPSWRSRFNVRGRSLDLAPPTDDLPGDFDPMFLGLGLDAIVTWRAETTDANVKAVLSWRIAEGTFELRWEERHLANGSLLDEHEVEAAHWDLPDFRTDSLAQVLLRRIMSAHRGLLDTVYDPAFVMTLSWPSLQTREPGKCGNGGR